MIHIDLVDFLSGYSRCKEFGLCFRHWKTGNTLLIQVNTYNDVGRRVSKAVTGAGGVIVGMSQKNANLEDIFIQLVTKDKEAKPNDDDANMKKSHPSWFTRFWAIVRYEMLWNIRKKKFIGIISRRIRYRHINSGCTCLQSAQARNKNSG